VRSAVNVVPVQILTINTDDLLTALRERNPQVSSWLDRETGEIYQISALFADDETEDDPAFAEAMQATPARFLRLPTLPAAVGFATVRAFVATVSEPGLRAALEQALSRQRAFFHFQDVLATAPSEQLRWQQQNRQTMLAWVDNWLQQNGVARRVDEADGR
jgi:hypothetical protein